jgi:hypothetical protein
MSLNLGSFGRVLGRLAIAAGFALALSACSMAVEQPPRAMFGTAAWSDAWQMTCSDVYTGNGKPQQVGYEHLNHDCEQYQVAQRMQYHQPEVALNHVK